MFSVRFRYGIYSEPRSRVANMFAFGDDFAQFPLESVGCINFFFHSEPK